MAARRNTCPVTTFKCVYEYIKHRPPSRMSPIIYQSRIDTIRLFATRSPYILFCILDFCQFFFFFSSVGHYNTRERWMAYHTTHKGINIQSLVLFPRIISCFRDSQACSRNLNGFLDPTGVRNATRTPSPKSTACVAPVIHHKQQRDRIRRVNASLHL